MLALFIPPQAAHLAHIAAHMREADRAEIRAAGGGSPLAELTQGVRTSRMAWSILADDEPVAVMGVVPLQGPTGVPWMLGTDGVARHAKALIPQVPNYIDCLLTAFPHLLNYAHAENRVAVAWLRRVGFTVHPAKALGPLGEMFHPFEMRRDERAVPLHRRQGPPPG